MKLNRLYYYYWNEKGLPQSPFFKINFSDTYLEMYESENENLNEIISVFLIL